MRDLRVIEDAVREFQSRGGRFLEAVHVDGRRLTGEFVGLADTPIGRQIILKPPHGREIRLFYAMIRRLES